MHPHIHSSVIYKIQDLEAAQVPVRKCVNKKAVGHFHNEILLGYKKEGTLTLRGSMDGPGEYYSK